MSFSREGAKALRRKSVFSRGGAEGAEGSRLAAPAAFHSPRAGKERALTRAKTLRSLRLCANQIFAPSGLRVNQISASPRLRVNQLQANH